jgi:hypothetical protein
MNTVGDDLGVVGFSIRMRDRSRYADAMGDRAKALTRQFVDTNLVELTKKRIVCEPLDDDPIAEWSDNGPIAKGSQNAALPVTSRTQTLADPMTTSLLAEVARRTATVEIDPSVLALALANTKPRG